MIYTSKTDGGELDHIITSEYDGAPNFLVTACGIDYIEAPVNRYRSVDDIPDLCSNCKLAQENGDGYKMRAAIWSGDNGQNREYPK